jgi:hypothetical protein
MDTDMTNDWTGNPHERKLMATIARLERTIEHLRSDVDYWHRRFKEERRSSAMWRDRLSAAEQAHEADVEHFNRVYNCGAQQ